MMKKALTLVLAGVTALSLTACGEVHPHPRPQPRHRPQAERLRMTRPRRLKRDGEDNYIKAGF